MSALRTKVFLSFPRQTSTSKESCTPIEEAYVHRVSYFLRKQPELEVFCYDIDGPDQLWQVHVRPHVSKAQVFVLFMGPELREGSGQHQELATWQESDPPAKVLLVVKLRLGSTRPQDAPSGPPEILAPAGRILTIEDLDAAETCAAAIYRQIHQDQRRSLWLDGLPLGYPFGYEKLVIDAFAAEGLRPFDPGSPVDPKRLQLRQPGLLAAGSPVKWPDIEKSRRRQRYGTPLPKEDNGEFRDDHTIIVDPRGVYHQGCSGGTCLQALQLSFPEAGPRSTVTFPIHGCDEVIVGIVVSGGIAPGINAVIGGIIERHEQYWRGASMRHNHSCKDDVPDTPPYRLTIRLFANGLIGITEERVAQEIEFTLDGQGIRGRDYLDRLKSAKSAGGTEIPTARHDELLDGRLGREGKLDEMVEKLTECGDCRVDVLYVVGGEGSMRAAHALAHRADALGKSLSVVGIPKTMDNDILWVWQSFGFLSAVEKAREFFTQLETEVRSNPRLCVMQLFGSDSGFVVSHTALAGGSCCLAALIPEIHFSMRKLAAHIKSRLEASSPAALDHGILVLAETAVPIDAEDYLEDPAVRLSGREKSAVRAFVGSALVREDEIRDGKGWASIVKRLRATYNHLVAAGPVSSCLRKGEAAFLDELDAGSGGGGEFSEGDQTRIVGILNATIRRNLEQWLAIGGNGSLALFGGPVRNAIESVKGYVENAGAGLSEQERMYLGALSTVMALPYEARMIIEEVRASERPNVQLAEQLLRRLREVYGRLVAETYLGVPERRWTEHRDRRVFGQTPDELRTASLKIVSRVLEREIQPDADHEASEKTLRFWGKYRRRVFDSEPRHLIRAIGPSCHDVIFGDRMGRLAVDGAMSGYRDFMISQWLTEYVLVPLPLVVLGRKRVPDKGIFWKSVIASTGQPANLWY